MPLPDARLHNRHTPLAELSSEHRTEPLPPEPHGLMADIHAPLMKQVLDVVKRKREPDLHHDGQADNFGPAAKALERVGSAYPRTLRTRPPILKDNPSDGPLRNQPARLKPVCSEKTVA